MTVCHQENVLFDNLTVDEHLRLFRSISNNQVMDAALTKDLQMDSILHKRAKELSGGNKRKLCLAMALMSAGQESVIVLDEPTSGMDPDMR